jgi:glycerol-3-phosphate dehydrogenase
VKRDLSALAAGELDLVVIGGGIYGAAAGWDATQRGLTVALVERNDFGAGASWNSLKTIHGGLRYLQKVADPRPQRRVAGGSENPRRPNRLGERGPGPRPWS